MRIASFLCCRLNRSQRAQSRWSDAASTTNNQKGENDGDSGKELEICDRVWQIIQMLMLRDQRLDCKAILPIYRLPVFQICFEVVWQRITAPLQLCSLVVSLDIMVRVYEASGCGRRLLTKFKEEQA